MAQHAADRSQFLHVFVSVRCFRARGISAGISPLTASAVNSNVRSVKSSSKPSTTSNYTQRSTQVLRLMPSTPKYSFSGI